VSVRDKPVFYRHCRMSPAEEKEEEEEEE